MSRACLSALVAVLGSLFWTATGQAVLSTPPGLQPGDEFRVVFVTSTRFHSGASSLIADYDAEVTARAVAGGIDTYDGMPVEWRIIGSTASVSAISRLPASSPPIYLVSGELVASSGADLWDGTLQNLITTSEFGTYYGGSPTGSNTVWTGTTGAGLVSGAPLGSAEPTLGNIDGGNPNWWIEITTFRSNDLNHLYGFSSVLTVPENQPPAGIPEPHTLAILAMAVTSMVRRRVRVTR